MRLSKLNTCAVKPLCRQTKRDSLDNLSSDEIREVVNLERPGIKPDLEELEDMGQNYATDRKSVV